MASRFRNALTVVPPVEIQVNRRGMATTIDWSGGGVERQAGATQMSLRSIGDARLSGPLTTDPYLIPGTRQNFGSGDVAAMTSPGLSEFKTLLLATRERQREIQEDRRKAKLQLFFSHAVRSLAWVTLAAAMSKPVREKVGKAVAVRKSEVATLEDNLTASRISISFDMEGAIAEPHREMLEAFDALSMSNRCWSIVNSQGIDRVKARTTASVVISRVLATLGRRADPLIDTQTPPLALAVQNGKATAYFYPGFILVVDGEKSDFAIIDLKDVDVLYGATRFTETETVPRDSTIVGKTWAKSNKDGSRDRRFNDNRELPVMLYGQMHLGTAGGMDEAFMFSNSDACSRFVSSVTALKKMLSSGTHNKNFGGNRKTLPKSSS